MSGPPFTDWIALQSWTGTYAALMATYPNPSIWTGFRVFTPDQGWCLWFDNQGWVPWQWWNPGDRWLSAADVY